MKLGSRFTTESVFLCYFEVTKDVTPTEAELNEFEEELFRTYNNLLDEIMPQNELDPSNLVLKSFVMMLAQTSGLPKPRLQVKNACAFLRFALDSMAP